MAIINFLKTVSIKGFHFLSDFLYPPVCFSCRLELGMNHRIFCNNCLNSLNWASAKERCTRCFSFDCTDCHQSLIYKKAFVFNYETLAAFWVRQFKQNGHNHLAQAAGVLMALQILKLDWQKPDLIVPVPSCPLRNWKRGYQTSAIIAKKIGQCLNIPVKNILRKSIFSKPQTKKNRIERLNMQKNLIRIQGEIQLKDLNVLLVDDVMTTGTSLECSAHALANTYPKAMYAMCFCAA